MPSLNEWFFIQVDEDAIALKVSPPGGPAWQETIPWTHIIRVCFKAGDWMASDEIYLFTRDRPESYLIPTEAKGGRELWSQILERNLFDADLAIAASTAINEVFCCPPH